MISTSTGNANNRIISIMTKMARDYNAIDLTNGTIDSETSDELIELVAKNLKLDQSISATIFGYLPLRENISALYKKNQNSIYDPETEITITNGVYQAISTAISTFVKENDEVIILEPTMDSYAPFVRFCNGVPVFVQMKEPSFIIDWEDVIRAITARTKMIIISNPNNPTGISLSISDMEKLSKILSGSKIVVLFEEVFEHLTFDNQEHISAARFPKLFERSIIISSFSRSLMLNGWNIGHCVAPDKLMREFRKIYQHIAFAVNYPLQISISEFIQSEANIYRSQNIYQAKRDLLYGILKDSKFELVPTQSTYYQIIDYSKISQEKDKIFANTLVSDFGVAAIPLSSFYHDGYDFKLLRLCFSKPDNLLIEAANRLLKV